MPFAIRFTVMSLLFAALALAQEVSLEAYTWDTVAIGGGGYVTGIVIHPLEPDLVYIRTDVGGAYRWDPETYRWLPLMDWIPHQDWNLYGIDGIALDPQNPDVVYVAAGQSRWAPHDAPSDVLKSTDRGLTWQRTGLNRRNLGNETWRWAGESIAVDPYNSSVVYAGTRYHGLWLSRDGAETWEQIDAIPTEPVRVEVIRGVRSIVFDPATAEAGLTQTIYVGVIDHGVFRSRDGGESWTLLEGSPSYPQRMAVDSAGRLYVTAHNGLRPGVFRLEGDSWHDISPQAGQDYGGLALDPHDDDHLVVSRRWSGFWNSLFRSTDGGASWTEITREAETHPNVPWWPNEYFSAATSALAFDPHAPGRVWLTDWYGIWRTPDISAPRTQWFTYQQGHEEMVVFSLTSTPSGAPLFTALADNDGMRHEDVTIFPARKYGGPGMNETTSVDFMEADPNVMARVGGWGWGERGSGGFSRDNGVSWTEFASFPTHGDGRRLPGGRIAVSATPDPATGEPTLIFLPYERAPYRSADMGASWERLDLPSGALHQHWAWNQPLAADRANGDLFYFYRFGDFYRSEDRGLSWRVVANLPRSSPNSNWRFVNAAPNMAGEVWVALDMNGLHRSSDAGDTFSRVEGVERALLFGFGKEAPERHNPTVFVYGRVHGVDGVFRSVDMGESWVRVNDDRHMMGNEPKDLTGDRQRFGVVYIGSGGRGVYVGAPAGTDLRSLKLELDDVAQTVAEPLLRLSGSTSLPAQVSVNGVLVEVTEQAFAANLRLQPGLNSLRLEAFGEGGRQAKPLQLSVTYDREFLAAAPDDVADDDHEGTVVARRTDAEMEIDGLLEEAPWDVSTPVTRRLMGNPENTVHFGVLWDEDYLYVGVRVLDEILIGSASQPWQNDSVEIYIDGNHSRDARYDAFDRQLVIAWGRDGFWSQRGRVEGTHAAIAEVDGGYSAEIAIPWSGLRLEPHSGMVMGFDVGNNDNDSGEGREHVLMWHGTMNNWQDTSNFGELFLGDIG